MRVHVGHQVVQWEGLTEVHGLGSDVVGDLGIQGESRLCEEGGERRERKGGGGGEGRGGGEKEGEKGGGERYEG